METLKKINVEDLKVGMNVRLYLEKSDISEEIFYDGTVIIDSHFDCPILEVGEFYWHTHDCDGYFAESNYLYITEDCICYEIEFEEDEEVKYPVLEEGLVAQMRDGEMYVVINSRLVGMNNYTSLNDYGRDLKNDTFEDMDIIKVFKTKTTTLKKVFDENNLKLVWERTDYDKIREEYKMINDCAIELSRGSIDRLKYFKNALNDMLEMEFKLEDDGSIEMYQSEEWILKQQELVDNYRECKKLIKDIENIL